MFFTGALPTELDPITLPVRELGPWSQVQKMERLDKQDLIDRFRAAGAKGAFLASTCDRMLDLEEHTNIIPEYQLKFAAERADEMRQVLRMALARDRRELESVAAHPKTNMFPSQTSS